MQLKGGKVGSEKAYLEAHKELFPDNSTTVDDLRKAYHRVSWACSGYAQRKWYCMCKQHIVRGTGHLVVRF